MPLESQLYQFELKQNYDLFKNILHVIQMHT